MDDDVSANRGVWHHQEVHIVRSIRELDNTWDHSS
jgi:hypothetical protein